MSDGSRNAQAIFLDAVKDRSLDAAVSILKNVHDGKGAVLRATRGAQAAGGVSPLAPMVPRMADVRRAGDLMFDIARLQLETLQRVFDLRDKHSARLEQRLGDLLGFPLRGSQGEVIELVVPVRAVELDRAERPADGESTSFCEIHRQFRAKNLTERALPAGGAVTPVALRWSRDLNLKADALRVDVLREPAPVPPGAVLPLRLRVRWRPGSLDAMAPTAEASGQFELAGVDGDVAKVIDVSLRFDLAGR
jgi:hypothetical protein